MPTMSPEQRDRIRAAASATTGPSPDVMPAWVANKPHCRWAWATLPPWRERVERWPCTPGDRRYLARWARARFADELRRREKE